MCIHVSLAGTHKVELVLCGETLTFDIPAGQSGMLGSHRIVHIPSFVSQ